MSIMQLTQTIHIVPSAQSRPARRPLQPALPGLDTEQPAIQVSNRDIAEVLANIAHLLEYQHGNPYRVQAYRNAARGVLDLTEPAVNILERGDELPIPGLGYRLRTRIKELVNGGTITFHDGICLETLPPDIRKLMQVEHVGPVTAIRLHEELGVDTLDKMRWAAQNQRIRKLPGFGPRSEARIKEAVDHLLQATQGEPLHGAA